ncbi:MAG: radical SAM protein [Micromonosporaceae bacterium]|nr:radical SAM protein [Micromonosporaceae bacterium]
MPARYARLTDQWLLRGWSDLPFAAVNWRNGDFRELGRNSFYVAQACDGRTDLHSAAFLPRHHRLLDVLIAGGIAEACANGDPVDPAQKYRRAENPLIRGICFSITSRCNLNCRHCFMEAPSNRHRDLTFADLVGLVDQFDRANVPEVALTGGEPLIRRDLPDVIHLLTGRRIGIAEVFSNGVLVTERILEEFLASGHRPYFKVSFDGCGAHDFMRGSRGCEAKVVRGIRTLREAGLPVTVITSVDRVSRDSMPETYELMKSLDVDGWWIAPPVEMGNWQGSTTGLSTAETISLCASVLRRWAADGGPFDLKLWRLGLYRKHESGEGRDADRVGDGVLPAPLFTAESWNCAGTHSRPYLLPDGTLLPCSGYTSTTLAGQMPNLLHRELSEVWNDPQLRDICDLRKRDLLARNDECASCEHFALCGSGCRVFALTETGDALARDPVACDLFRNGHIRRFREMSTAR